VRLLRRDPAKIGDLRPRDVICRRHRRVLTMIGAGSLLDLSGRGTLDALNRTRTQMDTCGDCQRLRTTTP
jgi:hypothetical protein